MTIPRVNYQKVGGDSTKTAEAAASTLPPQSRVVRTGDSRRRQFCRCLSILALMAMVLASITVVIMLLTPNCSNSLHASCKVSWTFSLPCEVAQMRIVDQIKRWTGPENCAHGGEKCLYKLIFQSANSLKATHTTPKKKYVDDLSFLFSQAGQSCHVQGYSTSEVWYAILDFGTNYCNLHNLITGSGLNATSGYKEETNNHICTQYTSADCEKY